MEEGFFQTIQVYLFFINFHDRSHNKGDISIQNCSFYFNFAQKGGALFYYNQRPLISHTKFYNNNAKYGANIASYPVNYKLLQMKNGSMDYIQNDFQNLTLRPSEKYSISSDVIYLCFFDFDNQLLIEDKQLFK